MSGCDAVKKIRPVVHMIVHEWKAREILLSRTIQDWRNPYSSEEK
jgi:hypothetical protein